MQVLCRSVRPKGSAPCSFAVAHLHTHTPIHTALAQGLMPVVPSFACCSLLPFVQSVRNNIISLPTSLGFGRLTGAVPPTCPTAVSAFEAALMLPPTTTTSAPTPEVSKVDKLTTSVASLPADVWAASPAKEPLSPANTTLVAPVASPVLTKAGTSPAPSQAWCLVVSTRADSPAPVCAPMLSSTALWWVVSSAPANTTPSAVAPTARQATVAFPWSAVSRDAFNFIKSVSVY